MGKWGFLLGLLFAGILGWALAGAVTSGCGPSRRGGCGVPDGAGWYFAGMMIAPWLLGFLAHSVTRHGGVGPTALGVSAGFLVGIAFVLSNDPVLPSMWGLTVVLAGLAIGTPLVAWRLGRSRRTSSARRWQP
jgi:hypothetical protein